ncbi:hypothetical protein ACQY1Q_08515 [Tenacibaculum sp. TC6]|uniref:hypothetical protein n=1 Tax=Tenacibaculum sp. TC6 TaxID=3423223 RepID=UPI003D367B6F
MKYYLIICLAFCFFSCKKQEKKDTEFIMHKQSEMAALMNTMYYVNLDIKEKIIKNQAIGYFPERFLKIHSATLTEPNDRTESFEQFSNEYIRNMKIVFEDDKHTQKENFNTAINSCITCHKTTCTGPIPRIQKLLIK